MGRTSRLWMGLLEGPSGDTKTRMNRRARVFSALSVAVIAASACDRSMEFGKPPASSYSIEQFTLTTEVSDTVTGATVSPEFFAASNARPLLGRFFLPVEYESEGHSVMVISNKLWRQRFSAAPQLIGTPVQLNGRAVTVVGVAPPGFELPTGAQVWVPRVPR